MADLKACHSYQFQLHPVSKDYTLYLLSPESNNSENSQSSLNITNRKFYFSITAIVFFRDFSLECGDMEGTVSANVPSLTWPRLSENEVVGLPIPTRGMLELIFFFFSFSVCNFTYFILFSLCFHFQKCSKTRNTTFHCFQFYFIISPFLIQILENMK